MYAYSLVDKDLFGEEGTEVRADDTVGEVLTECLRYSRIIPLQKLSTIPTKNLCFRPPLRHQLATIRRASVMSGTPKVVAKWWLIAAIRCGQWPRVAS